MHIEGMPNRVRTSPMPAGRSVPMPTPTSLSSSTRGASTLTDTFTPSAADPDARARVLDHLTRMREEILGTPAPAGEEAKLKSLQEISDEEFDRGLSFYEKHSDKTRALDPYLTETDKAMVGLMYEKYEKKYGEGSPQLDKVTRFAAELATLRLSGILVQTKEQKQVEEARAERREERAEAKKKEEAAQEKAREARERQVAEIDERIADLAK